MEGSLDQSTSQKNLDISIPCVIGKTALVQEIRHRPTAMGGGDSGVGPVAVIMYV